MQSSEMWKELGTNLRLFEKKSFQSTAKGCVELNSTALEGTDNYTGRCYFTLLLLGSFSREGSGRVFAVWQVRSPLGGPQRTVTSPFPFL